MSKRPCVICQRMCEAAEDRETCGPACQDMLEFRREFRPQDLSDPGLGETRRFHMSSSTWAVVHRDGSIEFMKKGVN